MQFRVVLAILMLTTGLALAESPAFDCGKAEAGSIEALICHNDELAKLDRTLATAYASALAKAKYEHPPVLKAEQRGWIKGRNECWKSDDKARCVADAYRRRIAELQARYRLVPGRGPFEFACDGSPANRIVVTNLATEPPTLTPSAATASRSCIWRPPQAAPAIRAATSHSGRIRARRG